MLLPLKQGENRFCIQEHCPKVSLALYIIEESKRTECSRMTTKCKFETLTQSAATT